MKCICSCFLLLGLIAVNGAFASWSTPDQINTVAQGLQATRDSDTPRAMATDGQGNIHFVIETHADTNNTLGIHYRKRNVDNSWAMSSVLLLSSLSGLILIMDTKRLDIHQYYIIVF
jgi:hypothetical protein